MSPLIDVNSQSECIKEVVGTGQWSYSWQDMFTSCTPPIPFTLQRSQGVWRRSDLPIAGLPSLKGLDIAVGEYTLASWYSVELAYATQGSSAFRGVIEW